MIAVSVARRALKARADHVRAKGADDAHHVGQRDIVATPFLEGLLGRLGKAEIGDAGEALFHSVIAVSGQQLQRANNAQFVEQIAADHVLAALAAIERQLQNTVAMAAGLKSQHAAIFVVGMGDRMHQARRGVQAAQHELEAGGSGVNRQRLGVDPRRRNLRRCSHAKRQQQEQRQREFST